MRLQRCRCCGEIATTREYEDRQLCLDCRFYHRHPEELEHRPVTRDCCRSSAQ